jgi:serine/threonine-protein kinase
MNRWPEVERLVDRLLELPVDERETFLASQSADDDDLRGRVERLMRGISAAEKDFLAQPAVVYQSEAEPWHSLEPGTVLGGYTIDREVGRGGMATVYRARDARHDRDVALKVLHPHIALAVGRERFLREIKVTASLRHSNILPLFDSGSDQESLFYVMPYVDGESLRDLLNREKPLPVEEAIRLTQEVAEALDHAHRHGVIHRDIKPENILVQEGHAHVADFGIALATGANDTMRLTAPGAGIGTPAYMSPEQAAARTDIGPTTDIYSLGCVLYEMLVGEVPFTARSPSQLVARHAVDPVPPIRTVRPEVPAEVEGAVQRALAKQPGDRFASAREFGRALAVVDSSARVEGRRLSRWVIAGIVGVLVMVLAMVFGLRCFGFR